MEGVSYNYFCLVLLTLLVSWTVLVLYFFLKDLAYKNLGVKFVRATNGHIMLCLHWRSNEGESAASFCRQVAALFPDIFCNFNLVKNHKIAKNLTTTTARKKYVQIVNP
jgi:hypothetical protein